MSKSYWQSVYVGNERSQEACRSWFGGLCDGMRVEKAEILCDKQTDREKKIRAVVVGDCGNRYLVIRTLGRRTYSVTRKALEAA